MYNCSVFGTPSDERVLSSCTDNLFACECIQYSTVRRVQNCTVRYYTRKLHWTAHVSNLEDERHVVHHVFDETLIESVVEKEQRRAGVQESLSAVILSRTNEGEIDFHTTRSHYSALIDQ